MSRLSDAEIQAELLSRGTDDPYYGEDWPSEEETRDDDERPD